MHFSYPCHALLAHLTTLQCKWLLLRLANDCHMISIRLAARIWGIVRHSFSPYHSLPPARKIIYLPASLSHITTSPNSHISITHS
ncbi:hypothetical protein L208DRAFT_208630 [Tricholoma matsutake]|nr:hypothetical protein L208DRAFT_208630 [Tricholoma matsutake 945]